VVDWNGFVAAWAQRDGGYDLRLAPAPVRGWLRLGYRAARGLRALGVQPATVSTAGVALAAVVPLLAGRVPGGLLLAAGLVPLSSLAGTVSRSLDLIGPDPGAPRRAVWQATAERLTEIAWLVGFWVAGVPGPLVVACGTLAGLHELVREQALAAGASRLGAQTIAEPPMRVSVSATGMALAGLAGAAGQSLASGMLTVAAVVWLLLALLGLGQLSMVVRKSLR
jgi:CDP-diacylglycerol--glycerol-3-phosphate 3-phosphatidyltransferase